MFGNFQNFFHTFFDWTQIRTVLPSLILTGLPNTIIISVCSIILGVLIGMVLAVALISQSVFIRFFARLYVDVFRGLPSILTILLIGEGLPIAGFHFFGHSAYPYAILALGILSGAYIAEIFRSGIQSVDRGQLEAARCLGMTQFTAMSLIVIPQGIRRVMPALANQFVAMVKDSSLVYLLGLVAGQRELFSIAQDQVAAAGSLAPLMAAGFFYILITVPMTHLVNWWDRRLRDGPTFNTTQLAVAAGEGR